MQDVFNAAPLISQTCLLYSLPAWLQCGLLLLVMDHDHVDLHAGGRCSDSDEERENSHSLLITRSLFSKFLPLV